MLAQMEFCTEFYIAACAVAALNCSSVCDGYILIFCSEIQVSTEMNSCMYKAGMKVPF